MSVVDKDGLRNTYTNAKGEQIDLDTLLPVDDETDEDDQRSPGRRG